MDDTQPVSRNGNVFNYNGDQGQRMIQIGDARQIADGDPGSEIFFRVKSGNGTFTATAAAINAGTGVIDGGSVTDSTLYNPGQFTIRFIDPDNYEVVDSGAAVIATGTFDSGGTIAFNGIQMSIQGDPATGDEFDVSPSVNDNVFAMIDDLATAVESIVLDETSRAAMHNGINEGILAMDQAIGNVIDSRTSVGSRLAAIDGQNDANASTILTLQETIADLQDLDYAEALSRLTVEASTLEAAQQSFIRMQNLSLFNYL